VCLCNHVNMSEMFFTVKEIAEILKYKEATIRSWIRKKKINAFMIGDCRKAAYRISEKELERLKKEYS